MSAFITLEIYRAMIHGDASRWAGANVAALYRSASGNGVLDEGDALLIGDLQALSKCAGLSDADLPFHALMVVMFDALKEGSLCVRCDEKHLRERLNALGLQEKLAKEMVRSLPLWRGLIGAEGDYKPLILRIGEFGKLLYFQRLYASERKLEARLKEMLASPACELDFEKTRSALKDVLEGNPAGGSKNPIRLNAGQLAVLAVSLANSFSIISGGPGTGKTTLIATVLRCLVRLGVRAEEIHLAAPAGRAAARMTESLRRALSGVEPNAADALLGAIEARTLHRTLGYRPSRNDFTFSANNPLEGKALIVDEASMIDAALMARLLEAVPAGMRVILVGDREQLPSVDAGAVLSDLLPPRFENGAPAELARTVKKLVGVELPEPSQQCPAHGKAVLLSVQQRAAKPLHPFIAAVREGNAAALLNAPESETLTWLDTAGMKPERWREFLKNWARRDVTEWLAAVKRVRETLDFEQPLGEAGRGLLERIFELQRRSRILTFVRGGEWGSGSINALLALYLREELDPRGPREYFAGLPVLITRNNYARRLFNGETGVALRDRQGRYRAVFESGGEWVFAPLDALSGAWEPGFALTVHKSQGSEFEHVLLCVPPVRAKDSGERMHRMLSRELLYTGITRAKQTVTLCGAREAIEIALKRRVERVSGIVLGEEIVGAPEPGLLF